MKTKLLRPCILSMMAAGLALVSGCVVEPNGTLGVQVPTIAIAPPVVVAPPPPVVVAPAPVVVAPAVAVDAPVLVPETYVWDGYENVGFVNGVYVYLGPGDVWVNFEPWRLDRFHGWERDHPDWRDHAIRNDRFRRDAHGRELARHDERAGEHKPGEPNKPQPKPQEKKEEKR